MIEQGLTVGQYLQNQRQEQKISLESVAGVTRISLANLQALEEDAFHLLPPETFIRGFLRSYAKYIHLDPAEVLAVYQRQVDAKRNQARDEELVPPPHPSFLKYIFNLFFDFLSTIAGADPSFSKDKAFLPPKN